jgi:polyhydroxyalkanoate synthesis regulator phasin
MKFSKQLFAKAIGVSVEQLEAQYRANIASLTEDSNKARSTGKKVRGYTADQLETLVSKLQNQLNS